jgi:hypothetical protein
MMWPTVEEDRLAELGELLHSKAQPAWRRHSIPLSITFFVLTCIAVAAFAAFLDLIRAPYGVATLAVCIGIAELLIQGYKFQRTGVESALWIAGPVAFIISLPSQGKPEALLVFAAAALMAGLRVRNPVFLATAAVLVDVYVSVKWHDPIATVVFALAITIGAGIALLREWQRPTTEWTWIAIVLVMPIASYIAAETFAVAYVLAAVVLIILGVHARHRALLVGGVITIAIAIFDAQKSIANPAEQKLIAAGVLVVAIAIALTRALRNKSRGFVTTKTSDRYEALQIIGAITIPTSAPPPSQDFKAGGGGFGGGGATGSV